MHPLLRTTALDCYDDLELVRRFRFSRVSISQITELIASSLNFSERSYAASPHLQVCVALQFFASGSFQIICGDGINVSQASASRYIRDVSLGLQAICHQFVSLPAGLKGVEVKNKFYEIAHFPGVVGLVDGTHIRIQRPSENEADYIIGILNTQLTFKLFANQMECLVMYCLYDSRIWKISGVEMHVENTFSIGEHILGDSGYMLRPYLLTPYRHQYPLPNLNTTMHIRGQGVLLNRHLDDGNEDSTVFMGSSG